MDKLKACPFCGGNAQLVTDRVNSNNGKPFSYIFCKDCKAHSYEYFDDAFSGQPCKERAIEAWNKRSEG